MHTFLGHYIEKHEAFCTKSFLNEAFTYSVVGIHRLKITWPI